MNKFTKLLSDNTSTTLARRAKSLATSAQIAQENLINDLKQKKCELELRQTSLTDFAPESTDSLRPCDKDWNAQTWVNELQNVKQQLYNVKIQISLAEETFNEFFKDEQ